MTLYRFGKINRHTLIKLYVELKEGNICVGVMNIWID